MDAKDEMIHAFCQFVEGVTIYRDVERSMAVVAEDVLAVGMGEQGVAYSKEELRLRFKLSDTDARAAYSVAYSDVRIHDYPGGFGTVCGTVHIARTLDGVTTKSGIIQSASMRRENGRWLICASQATPLMVSEESIQAYPLQFADKTLERLRSDIYREAQELTGRSFLGGVLGTHIQGDAYPLCFANEGMFSLLGYPGRSFTGRSAATRWGLWCLRTAPPPWPRSIGCCRLKAISPCVCVCVPGAGAPCG